MAYQKMTNKMGIEQETDLPELVKFRLDTGEVLNIRHLGNRIEVSLVGGSYSILAHPRSSNSLEIIPANQEMVSMLAQPPIYPKEKD